MSTPNSYFTKRSQMTAVLKKDAHRVAARNPKQFVEHERQRDELVNQGRFSVVRTTKIVAADANPLAPAYRHSLAWGNQWEDRR